MHLMHPPILSALLFGATAISASQLPLADGHSKLGYAEQDEYYQFSQPIRRVAVIGAGPCGLQAAASLIDDGFEVRLFERQDKPGGNWYYRDQTAVQPAFPSRPAENGSYVPDLPPRLPYTRIYEDGEGGVSTEWRIREQENPSAVWKHMTANSAQFVTSLPNIEYPPDTPWRVPNWYIQRHVRQYASLYGLNSNDEENANVTSYSTRVERIHKQKGTNKWKLTLRKLERLPYSDGKVRAQWWTEEFDAVVAASSNAGAAWIPDIPNLDKWAKTYPERIFHSREYRTPSKFEGKNVLIIGGSISAHGIAVELVPGASSVSVSIRNHTSDSPGFFVAHLPANITIVPEIKRFPDVRPSDGINDVRNLQLTLVNGSTITGYDHIILATGFRRSNPFMADFYNNTIKGFDEPETDVAPIMTDGTHTRSLHWTGHYIDDPTLVLTHLRPWTVGRYQAIAISRVWSGKARLPGRTRMWEEYPGAGKELRGIGGREEWLYRLFITWLNNEALEFGGRLVDHLPRYYNAGAYFGAKEWNSTADAQDSIKLENTPRSEWPSRNGHESPHHSSDLFSAFTDSLPPLTDETWAEWNPYW